MMVIDNNDQDNDNNDKDDNNDKNDNDDNNGFPLILDDFLRKSTLWDASRTRLTPITADIAVFSGRLARNG